MYVLISPMSTSLPSLHFYACAALSPRPCSNSRLGLPGTARLTEISSALLANLFQTCVFKRILQTCVFEKRKRHWIPELRVQLHTLRHITSQHITFIPIHSITFLALDCIAFHSIPFLQYNTIQYNKIR